MIPYRPVPCKLPGARVRTQAMNDAFDEQSFCGLLDSLVFYPVWIGSQCVDMVSGSVLSNYGSVGPKNSTPSGEIACNFNGFNALYAAHKPDYIGTGGITFGCWINTTETSGDNFAFAKWNAVTASREWVIYNGSGSLKIAASPDGTSVNAVSISMGNYYPGWNCVMGSFTENRLIGFLNGMQKTASLSAIFAGNSDVYMGSWGTSSGFMTGATAQYAIWKRCLSYFEHKAYYANGQGINLSKFL